MPICYARFVSPTGLRVLIPCAMSKVYEARFASYINLLFILKGENTMANEIKRSLNYTIKDLSTRKSVSTKILKELFSDEIKRLCYRMQECKPEYITQNRENAYALLSFAYINLNLYNDKEFQYLNAKITQYSLGLVRGNNND